MKKIFLLMFFLFIFVSCDEEGLIDEEIQVVRDTIDTMYAVSETHSEENIRELKLLLPSAVEILNKYSVQELPEETREIFQNLNLEFISASIILEDAGYYISDFVEME